LAVKRNFKNADGIFDTDFITCSVWNIIAEKVCEFCRKGDLISVKARVQNNNYLDKDDKKIYSYEFVAEQVSFLQNSKNNDKEEENDLVEVETDNK
jgi:single-strand DNA-binding protein